MIISLRMKSSCRFLLSIGLALPLTATAQTLATPPASPPQAKVAAKPAPAKPKESAANTVAKAAPTAAPKPAAAPPKASGEVPQVPVPVQESKIQRLISEREQLILKYDYLKTQESSFWGNASKKDMVAVLDALKEVLNKDSEIIQAVSEQTLEARRAAALRAAELQKETERLNSQVKGDKRMVTDNIYDLKATLQNAQNLNRRRERQIRELEEKVAAVGEAKFEHDAIAAIFAMLSMVLIGYVVHLRGKMKNRPITKKRMKKA